MRSILHIEFDLFLLVCIYRSNLRREQIAVNEQQKKGLLPILLDVTFEQLWKLIKSI